MYLHTHENPSTHAGANAEVMMVAGGMYRTQAQTRGLLATRAANDTCSDTEQTKETYKRVLLKALTHALTLSKRQMLSD
jgi:hypothetical protein